MRNIFRYVVSDERKLGDSLVTYTAQLPNDGIVGTLLEWTPSLEMPATAEARLRFRDLINNRVVVGFENRQRFYVVVPQQASLHETLAKLQSYSLFLSSDTVAVMAVAAAVAATGASVISPRLDVLLELETPPVQPVEDDGGEQLSVESNGGKRAAWVIVVLAFIASILCAYWFAFPRIKSFSTESTAVEIGDEVTLHWSVEAAQEVELRDGDTILTWSKQLQGSFNVRPIKSSTYDLIAISLGAIKNERKLEVAVSQPPLKIDYFRAVTNPINGALPVRISWQVSGAETINIDPGGVAVTRYGSKAVDSEVIYTLTATAPGGKKVAEELDTSHWGNDGDARVSKSRSQIGSAHPR